jgi:CxxC motif-containing protein
MNNHSNAPQSTNYDSEDEALMDFLGGIDLKDVSGDAWENESQNSQEIGAGKAIQESKVRLPIAPLVMSPQSDFKEISEYSTKDIFSMAYKFTVDGRIQPPAVSVVEILNKGNALVATRDIRRGEIIFTERAAAAIQLDSRNDVDSERKTPVRACQNCYRSLEPASSSISSQEQSTSLPLSELWPVCEYEVEDFETIPGTTLSKDKQGRIACRICKSMFCSISCNNAFLDRFGCCCIYDQTMKAAEVASLVQDKSRETIAGDEDGFTPPELQPAILLATHVFCTIVHQCRDMPALSIGEFQGICGSSSDIVPLELGLLLPGCNGNCGAYTLKPMYEAVCKALSLYENEQEMFSLDLYCQFAAMAARNGFEISTKSPFSIYYSALRSAAGGWGSERHSQLVRQVASALGSTNGELQRGMDKAVGAKVAVNIAALFPLIARINHSCEACAEVQGGEFVDAHVDVVATRDIGKGQEITISYINLGKDEGKKARHRRMKELQARYLFICQCPRCLNPSD